MMNHTKPTSLKIIYWVTNIIFWIISAISVLGVILSLGLIFELFPPIQLHVGIPVQMEVLEIGKLEVKNISADVQFVEMTGKVHIMDTPKEIGKIYGFFIIIILLLFYYMMMTFRTFINNVYKGMYFDRKNIMLLKRIAYGLIGVWIFTVSYAYFQYYYLVKNMTFESIKSMGEVQTFGNILSVALFVWVLSHIFQKGVELKNENELTI